MYTFMPKFKLQKVLMLMLAAGATTFGYANTTQEELAELHQKIAELSLQLQEIKQQQAKDLQQQQVASSAESLESISPISVSQEKKSFLSNNGAEVNLYGYIRGDASYQSSGGAAMYNSINTVPLKNTEEALKQRDKLRTTAAATRIGVSFKTPTPIGEVGGKFETDFYGGATQDQFRIRHAYLTYGNWLLGQTWSNFIAPEYLPETIDAATFVGGSLQRTPTVRYTGKMTDQANFILSIEDPKYTTTTDPEHEMRLPALVGRINHGFENGSAISGRGFVAEKKTSQDDQWAWGVGLGGKYQITPETMLKADYYHVKGDGRFLFWTNNGYVIDENKKMHSNEFDTISLGLTHQFHPKIRSTLGYGYMRAQDDNTFARMKHNDASQNKSLSQGWINAVYSPVKPINLGLEYVYGERETFDGRNGIDNRINMNFIYDF